MKRFTCATALVLLFTAQASLADSNVYPDGHGGEVTFPQGDTSFADEVVHYTTGGEKPADWARSPDEALGIPDYDRSKNRGYASLGCGGELVLKFIDNALIDIPGPDLYVFEVGPAIEPTALAISQDGRDWIRIGRIEGGKADIDIAPYVSSGAEFRYVRMVDLKEQCGGGTPGADIDAVGAIGSAQRIALDSEVLFGSGEYELKSAAADAINEAIVSIDADSLESVAVAGHTDSVGSASANQLLSEKRARSVTDYLLEEAGLPGGKLKAQGYGASQSIADNRTAEGRAENRRVEITLRTKQEKSMEDAAQVEILGLWLSGKKRVIELRHEDGAILGNYTRSDGQLRGEFTSDTVFEGHWIKDKTARTCDSEKAGSQYWGSLRFDFESAEHDAFDVKWAYCDDDDWSGSWPHAERIL